MSSKNNILKIKDNGTISGPFSNYTYDPATYYQANPPPNKYTISTAVDIQGSTIIDGDLTVTGTIKHGKIIEKIQFKDEFLNTIYSKLEKLITKINNSGNDGPFNDDFSTVYEIREKFMMEHSITKNEMLVLNDMWRKYKDV